MKNKKLQLARRMAPGHRSGVFITPQWEARKRGIASRVQKTEKNQQKHKENIVRH